MLLLQDWLGVRSCAPIGCQPKPIISLLRVMLANQSAEGGVCLKTGGTKHEPELSSRAPIALKRRFCSSNTVTKQNRACVPFRSAVLSWNLSVFFCSRDIFACDCFTGLKSVISCHHESGLLRTPGCSEISANEPSAYQQHNLFNRINEGEKSSKSLNVQ